MNIPESVDVYILYLPTQNALPECARFTLILYIVITVIILY